jgi:hypothetical protein
MAWSPVFMLLRKAASIFEIDVAVHSDRDFSFTGWKLSL